MKAKKLSKKALSLLLSFCMIATLFSVIPITASASISGKTGDCTWILNNDELTISGNGKMADYTKTYYGGYITTAPWGDSYIKKVTIGSGVTYIGKYAFSGCHLWLASIDIHDSVTAIGEYAFYKCSGIKELTIGNGITAIGNSAFYNCSRIEKVNISDISKWCNIDFEDSSANPLSVSRYIYYKNQLTPDIVIPYGVKTIKNYAFYNCASLSSITIPNTVTEIGNSVFLGCEQFEICCEYNSFAYRYARANKLAIKTINHNFISFNTPATYFKKGKINTKCTLCGKVKETKTIAKLKLKTPKVKITAKKKSFKVKLTKVSEQTGFQVRHRIKGKKKWAVKTFKAKKSVTKTLKKLKSKKKYQIAVRAYVQSGSEKAYSKWSKTYTKKTK